MGDTRRAELAERIAPLLADYLDDCTAKVEAMAADLERGDYEAIQRAAHNLRGSGGSFGVPLVSLIAGETEDAAKRRDTEATRAALARLLAALRDARRS